MKSVYYSGLARMELGLKCDALTPVRRFLGRRLLLRSMARRGKRWAANVLLPNRPKWVKVESGLAQGVWLHLNLRDEGAYWLGSYEARVQDLLKKLCGPRSVFYDIGANLGFFTFAVAKSIGPEGRVIAFEPEPDNCIRFKEMVIRNSLQDRVELVEAAAWSYTSSTGIPFKRGDRPGSHGGVLADGVRPVLAEGETVLVPAVSVDDFLRKGQPPPGVLKIDVEGGECEVLKGAAELLYSEMPALICEVHCEQAAQWIADWLALKGYALEWRVPAELYPRLLLAQATGAGQRRRSLAHE